MGEQNWLECIRELIGDAGFAVFLWARGWTEDQYVEMLRENLRGERSS